MVKQATMKVDKWDYLITTTYVQRLHWATNRNETKMKDKVESIIFDDLEVIYCDPNRGLNFYGYFLPIFLKSHLFLQSANFLKISHKPTYC
jgi:hypothetical protein